jgi:MFS superfamily sulfate permease-like transporter
LLAAFIFLVFVFGTRYGGVVGGLAFVIAIAFFSIVRRLTARQDEERKYKREQEPMVPEKVLP